MKVVHDNNDLAAYHLTCHHITIFLCTDFEQLTMTDEITVKKLSAWTTSILKGSIIYDAPGMETSKTVANNANIKQVVADTMSMESTDIAKATSTKG